jgi:hypothetical protein
MQEKLSKSNSFVELPSTYNMFDRQGIHNIVTKRSRRFSVFTDTSLPDKDTLSCLKTSWEMGQMTGKPNERCYFTDYLLNTFQQVLNVTFYCAQSNVHRNLTAFKFGTVIVQNAISTFPELQNNMLSQLGEVTREVLYCQDSIKYTKTFKMFITAFDPHVWGILLLFVATGALILCLQRSESIEPNCKTVLGSFAGYCFEIFGAILEQNVRERKAALVGFSLTTAFLLNVYRSEILTSIVVNPIPPEILSISQLLEYGYVLHLKNGGKSFDNNFSVYSSIISSYLEVETRKKFQRSPERYLDMSNGPDRIMDLRRVFSTSPKYALLLFGAKSGQNAYLNYLKLAFEPKKVCRQTKHSVDKQGHFAKFLNPLFVNFKIMSQSLHEGGFIQYWNELVNHMYSLLIKHTYSEQGVSGSNDFDDLITIKHLCPVMIIYLCFFAVSSLVLVFEIVLGHSYCERLCTYGQLLRGFSK